MDRQHNYTSLSSTLPMFSTLLDQNSVNKFMGYNFNLNSLNQTMPTINRLSYDSVSKNDVKYENIVANYNKLLPSRLNPLNKFDFSMFINLPNNLSILGAENDSKQYSNPFKFSLNLKHKKLVTQNLDNLSTDSYRNNDTLESLTHNNHFSTETHNTENTLKFKDYKSSNAQFLGSERTARLLTNLNSNSFKWNTSASPNLVNSLNNSISTYGGSANTVYNSSVSN
jgi:hypothetical protein